MNKIISKIKILLQDIKINSIGEHAAGCAYFTILAFIPLIILILTLTRYIGINEELLVLVLSGMIPTGILNDAVTEIVKEVSSKSVGTITISAIVTLWSAGKGFFALCKGLNSVYNIETKNKYIKFRLRALIATIIFIISVVASLLLLVFGNSINLFLQQKFNIFSELINLVLKNKIILSVVLLTVILSILYRFIPKHKYKLKKQIPGAFVAAVTCNVISEFFSIYVELFNGFSLMYGSLTTIVLAMMWVYACMYTILLGGSINKMIAENEKIKSEHT